MPDQTTASVNTKQLRLQVQEMYRKVADEPRGEYHFEMGSELAERLGYPSGELALVPPGALESFAGVGYYFDLAEIEPGETVLDLGSGSGTDAFLASLLVGPTGRVIGVDMTEAQLDKANALRLQHGFTNTEFRAGYLESLPVEDESIDVVISNGVINLSPEKQRVFAEVFRVLRPGGRMAIADIVTDQQLPDSITCNTNLWAACIGGAAQRDSYAGMIQSAGLERVSIRENPAYRFLSRSAQNATAQYGVKSANVLAWRPVP